MKPASAKPAPGHHRCLCLSATGRKCRSWVLDSRAMFCPRHMQAQPNGPDDFSLHLLHRACNFQNAEGIHDSLRQLYTLLASDAISPRPRRCTRLPRQPHAPHSPRRLQRPPSPSRHSHVRSPIGRTPKSQVPPRSPIPPAHTRPYPENLACSAGLA